MLLGSPTHRRLSLNKDSPQVCSCIEDQHKDGIGSLCNVCDVHVMPTQVQKLHLKLKKASIRGQARVDKDLLNSIAGRRVVNFGVYADALCRLDVDFWVDVDVADPISMAKDWDAGVVLDVRDQLI